MVTTTKIIVSNKSALTKKYSPEKFNLILTALDSLITADRGKGIDTTLILMDDQVQMTKYSAIAVVNALDDQENKLAIDGLYKNLTPDYIMILGAQDIVPMQLLVNPITSDPDPNVPSDLPYCSNNPYSKIISDFKNPSRVVGRLPGVYRGSDPTPLITAIDKSSVLSSLTRDQYDSYFAVSTQVWGKSTATSVKNIFGNSTELYLSPTDGPNWSTALLENKVHFVNCHGSSYNSSWYGQQGNNYPEAVEAALINKKEVPGTIVAAECCYGAELYYPGGICNAYLVSNVSGFCGSTNVAYGPSEGNGEADLITQYFIINTLAGASTGRAMLQARQSYITNHSVLNNYDLKTIAQFLLLGDPSAHPVQAAEEDGMKRSKLFDPEHKSVQRKVRRQMLLESGEQLNENTRFTVISKAVKPSELVEEHLNQLVADLEIKDPILQSSIVSGGSKLRKMKSFIDLEEQVIHELSGQYKNDIEHITQIIGVIIVEQLGKVVSSKITYSKMNDDFRRSN